VFFLLFYFGTGEFFPIENAHKFPSAIIYQFVFLDGVLQSSALSEQIFVIN